MPPRTTTGRARALGSSFIAAQATLASAAVTLKEGLTGGAAQAERMDAISGLNRHILFMPHSRVYLVVTAKPSDSDWCARPQSRRPDLPGRDTRQGMDIAGSAPCVMIDA